jgi:predicted TIM-barrel fold metal-dependent hydrolase
MIVDGHCWLGRGVLMSQTESALLRSMDRSGIDMAAVSPPDTRLVIGNRAGNRALARAVARHPDRLIGYAGVNPWLGARAADELRRARDLGLRALYVNPRIQGVRLLDPHLVGLVETAAELGLPVHIATGTPIAGHPLTLAELARRVDRVSLILGSGGHSDFWIDVIPAMRAAPTLWLEVSYKATHVIREYVEALGAERIVFGSDAPANDQALEIAKLRAAGLAPEAFDAVAGRNLLRLLGIVRGAPA